MSRVAFIGHRNIYEKNLISRLSEVITAEVQSGCQYFTMGVHGEFDRLALNVCRKFRKTYPDIEIEVVITSLNSIKKDGDYSPYSDVKTVMYDIENAFYKQKITLSNRNMIDTCDKLICYVNEKHHKSGAKAAMNYAKKQGLEIINLYDEKYEPFCGMTKTEIENYMRALSEKVGIRH